jgi:hypothetical protein
MNTIRLAARSFEPYGTVTGAVHWSLEKPPEALELRLFWFTRGRGTEEAQAISTLDLDSSVNGERPFSFVLPGSPWSIDGRLVSIVWGIELVEKKQGSLALEEFVMGPDGKATVLSAVESPRSGSKLAARFKNRLKPQS